MTGSRRTSLLVSPHDALPDGARLVEAHFSHPAVGWEPVIEGAVIASLENSTIAAAPSGGAGRFPLPSADELARTLKAWGITEETPVVVYAASPADAKVATRAWFVLRHAGVGDVRVLDGGAAAWVARTQAEYAVAAPASTAPVIAIDADEAAATASTGLLIDARPATAFAAGRIPGAFSAPGDAVFRDGYLLSDAELQRWVDGLLGAERPDDAPLAAYCGGGVAASGTVFALTVLGLDPALYVGSWSQWSGDAERPVES